MERAFWINQGVRKEKAVLQEEKMNERK